MTAQWPHGTNAALFASRAEAVSPNSEGGYKDDPPAGEGRKVVIADTDHLWGTGGNFRWVWKSFLRGLNPTFMDPYMPNFLGYNAFDSAWEPIRWNMGYTRQVAEVINLAAMKPRSDLASSRYCLAEPGEEYVVYAETGRVEVDLSGARKTFNVEWLRLSTGVTSRDGVVAGGQMRSFTAPFQGDAVLRLFVNGRKVLPHKL